MTGRRLVITGASSAIGQAIARRLAAPSDHLLLHACRHDPLGSDCPAWPAADYQVIKADFRQRDDLAAFCRQAAEADVLINAAAVTATGLLAGQAEDAIEAMLAVNIRALIVLCQAVLPGMTARRRGVIVNLSSAAASRGNRGQAVYAGSKGFVEAFTRSLAAEYGPRGIRVNAVAPGAIDAGSLKALLAYAPAEVNSATALPRLGTPEDVAAAVAFLCADDAAFINGKCLGVDGGFCRGV